jgi:hypothetical protein
MNVAHPERKDNFSLGILLRTELTKNEMTCQNANTLSLEHDGTTSLADLLVGLLADPAGLDDAGHVHLASAEQLGVAAGLEVDDGEGLALLRGSDRSGGNQLGQVAQVDGGLPRGVGLLVEVAHTDLTEVSGMVLVEVDAVVVLTTGVTATRLVLLVLSDAAITAERGTTLVTALLKAGRHPES